MKILGLKYVVFLNGCTAYEWQIMALYGRFTKLRYWWRCPSWRDDGSRVTHWHDAVFIGWDREWKRDWDLPETPQ